MGQKIVITANLNNTAKGVAHKVEYQWHWRRIGMVVGLLCAIIFTMVYATEHEGATESKSLQQIASEKHYAVTGKDTQPTAPSTETAKVAEAVPAQVAFEQTEQIPAIADASEPELAPTQEEVSEGDVTSHADVASHTLSAAALGTSIDTEFVTRALLTTEVVDREPVDVLGEEINLSSLTGRVMFFTEIKGLTNTTVRHNWYFNDEQVASIELSVKAPRYRTYSSKRMIEQFVGHWRVELVDSNKRVLAQKTFSIN